MLDDRNQTDKFFSWGLQIPFQDKGFAFGREIFAFLRVNCRWNRPAGGDNQRQVKFHYVLFSPARGSWRKLENLLYRRNR